MTTFVIEHDREIASKPHDDITPDAEIRAEGIGENDDRLVSRTAYHLVMDCDVIDMCKLH